MLGNGRLNTNQRDDIVSGYTDMASRIMQLKHCEVDSEKVPKKFSAFSDCLQISAEGNKQYMITQTKGNTEMLPVYSLEEMGKEAWEAATGVKVLFYLESSNIAGTEASVFQRYQNSQYKVFQQFLEDNDAYGNREPEVKEKYETMLKDITKAMDRYGDGGYNGISRNAMLLSQNMIAQLEYFNTNYVPDDLQGDFRQLIEECDYFNQNSREKMFADSMPCDIVESIGADGRLIMKEKSVVIKNYLEYSRQEKDEIRKSFADIKGKRNLSDIYAALRGIERRYSINDFNIGAKNIFLSMRASWKKLI